MNEVEKFFVEPEEFKVSVISDVKLLLKIFNVKFMRLVANNYQNH